MIEYYLFDKPPNRPNLSASRCWLPLRRRCGAEALTDHVSKDGVAAGIEMYVPKIEVLHVPATGLPTRALFFRGKELREGGDEAFALAIAPIAPHAHLAGVNAVMDELLRPRINDYAERDIALLQLLPKQIHLLLLLLDAAFHSQRSEPQIVRHRFVYLPIRPGSPLKVENISEIAGVKVIAPESDKIAFKKFPNVIREHKVLADGQP